MLVQFYSFLIIMQVGYDMNYKGKNYFPLDSQLYFQNQTHFQNIKKILSEVVMK